MFTFTTRVADDGPPSLSATNSFTVVVNEVNTAPQLTVPGDQTIAELTPINVAASATDSDLPANALIFALISPPAGMTINTNTGAINWTPTEAQGPTMPPPSRTLFFTDFNAGLPAGCTLYGNAAVADTGGVDGSGVLMLTSTENGQQGSFVLGDLGTNQPTNGFWVEFQARVGGVTTHPADGFSFNFAHDLPQYSFGEEGIGSGLTVSFDSYDNGGGEAPAI